MFTNARKLAMVVSEWARPAVSQIAASKFSSTPMMRSLKSQIINWGLVTPSYEIESDVAPLLMPVVNSIMMPMLERYFSKLPDEAIPEMAHKVSMAVLQKGQYTILDGLVSFDSNDLSELRNLIEKNLPIEDCETYEVLK